MQLTYTTHLHTQVQCVIDTGETLGTLEGPCVVYCPVDGTNAVYADILAQDLVVTDPLDTPAVLTTLEAEVEAKAAAAEEARAEAAGEEGEEHPRRKNKKHK
jgi:hypothetical protein